MKKMLLLLGTLLLTAALDAAPQSAGKDLTSKLEKLGNPLSERYGKGAALYARNIWTMQAFDNKIFIGAGNSANGGPAANAGPVPVYSFDPRTKKFTKEWSVPDEQIDVYRVFDNTLYIPGHDPKEDWKLGNFYRRKAGSPAWEKVRTIPDGVHCYDLAVFKDKLYAAGYGICESSDSGATFTALKIPSPRYYAFLCFPNTLYAVADCVYYISKKNGRPLGKNGSSTIARGDGRKEFKAIFDQGVPAVFPNTDIDKTSGAKYKIARTLPFNGKVLYIGGFQHVDHQIAPVGAYSAADGKKCFKPSRIKLPDNATPWFFISAENKAFILFSTEDPGGGYVNNVWQSADGLSFTPLFSFKAPSFARSFEYLDGYFYFGLGTEIKEHGHFEGNSLKLNWSTDELNPAAGEIYRIKFNLK